MFVNFLKKSLALPIFLISVGAYAHISPGLWSTDCLKGSKKEQSYRAKTVLTKEHFFQDGQCSDPAFLFSTDGRVEFPSEDQTYIDFVYVSIFLTLYKESLVENFNNREVCGIKNWKLGNAHEITGLNCAIFTANPAPIPAAGDVRYGIHSVEGSKLYYGRLSQQSDGTSPAARPKALNRTTEYIFQHSL